MVRAFLAVLLVALGAGAVLAVAASEKDEPARQAAEPPVDRTPASGRQLLRAVTAERVGRHLDALQRIAERSDGNRAAGTPGYDRSAEYVAARLRRAGFTVREQRVRFPMFDERSPPRLEGVPAPRDEVMSLAYSASGSARGRVQEVPELGCSTEDFARFARGRVALVRRGTCPFRRKVLNAQSAGAAAVVVQNSVGESEDDVVRGTLGSPGAKVPALLVSERVGERIRPGALLRIRVDALSGNRTASNVIAEAPGRGRRVVMAGAHLDSVTDGPGINDNGTGVAALLALAEATEGRDLPGNKRLRLGFWTAEELGLYGSRRYVRSLAKPERERIAAYLNLDMVGSPNAGRFVYGEGGGSAKPMLAAARRLLARRGVPAERDDLGGGSDHAPFRAAGIPVAGVFSGASGLKSDEQAERWGGRAGRSFDPCYHRACDRAAGIDRRALGQLADAAVAAVVAGLMRT